MTKTIFVGGTGRSGTSIVKDILASHPDAASLPFEYRFIIDPDGLVDFYTSYAASWSPYLADRRLKRLKRFLSALSRAPLQHRLLGRLILWWNGDGKTLSPRRYHGWELNRHLPNWELHTKNLMSRLIEFSFPACWVGTESYQLSPKISHAPPRSRQELAQILGEFIENVIGDLVEQTAKVFFVEDNTWNILFAKEILELVPAAKIIHVYRDPRDVVASFSHQRWSPSHKEKGANWYRAIMNHWLRLRPHLPNGSYYELKLEDLVASPEDVLRDVCGFADIRFDAALLRSDLSHSHAGRWENEYDARDKAEVQPILAGIIEELGYDLVSPQ